MLPRSEKPLVLIVDDEAVIALTLSLILQKEGFETRPFTEPLEALEFVRTEAPDFLISDVVMPHLSGVDLAIEVKSLYPECKILLFSGQAATGRMVEDARGKGHEFDLLTKPVPPPELLNKVRAMLAADLLRH